MKRTLAALIALSLPACAPAPQQTSTADDPIQGGRSDSGDPAVGLLWFQGGGFCTGTLIAPDVVLTAAHCVQDPLEGFYTGSGHPSDGTSADPPRGMKRHPVADQVNHPSFQPGQCPNTTFDIGLVLLGVSEQSITPLAYNHGKAPAVNKRCRAVGFGAHDSASGVETFEAKRAAFEDVLSVSHAFIQVGADTGIADHGDSGGPLICGTTIAGATSCHTDGNFPDHSVEFYARIDDAVDFIDQQINTWHGN
jgi:hypothetical protein